MQKKVVLNERDFFKKPFSREDIENLLSGKSASEMFNLHSPSFKKMGLDRDKLKDKDMLDLMLKEPRLILRHVARIGKRVYFGADSKLLAEVLK